MSIDEENGALAYILPFNEHDLLITVCIKEVDKEKECLQIPFNQWESGMPLTISLHFHNGIYFVLLMEDGSLYAYDKSGIKWQRNEHLFQLHSKGRHRVLPVLNDIQLSFIQQILLLK